MELRSAAKLWFDAADCLDNRCESESCRRLILPSEECDRLSRVRIISKGRCYSA